MGRISDWKNCGLDRMQMSLPHPADPTRCMGLFHLGLTIASRSLDLEVVSLVPADEMEVLGHLNLAMNSFK